MLHYDDILIYTDEKFLGDYSNQKRGCPKRKDTSHPELVSGS